MNTQINPKLVNKYLDILAYDVMHIDEKNIVSLRSFLSNKCRHDKEVFQAIMRKANSHEKVLTAEHNQKGIEWLRRTQFKKNGQLSTAKTTFIGEREAHVIRNFSHFTFIGLVDESSNQWPQPMPIYKCYATDGTSFEYVASFNMRVIG